MKNNEFYIGWMPEAPPGFAKHIRVVVIVLICIVVGTGFVLSRYQKTFSTASFEYGQLTEVSGIFQKFPIPSLKVITKADPFNRVSYITMPLTGFGKFGAEGIISDLEKDNRRSFDGKQITLKGTLIYHDGKTLLQIDKNDDPLVKLLPASYQSLPHETRNIGNVQLTGEILDPKCYFGVMKPGSGKPHRDCAIRCIEGGMSPVLMVRDEEGNSDYYLLLDKSGKKMNHDLKDYVAEPISLYGKAMQYDDWKLLYVDKESIKRTGGLSLFKSEDEITSCGR